MKEFEDLTDDEKAQMIRDLNGELLSFMERIGDLSQWLISFVDTRTPMRADGEVYLAIGHRSVNNGNMLARIDCCEVERLTSLPESKEVISGGVVTFENGFKVSGTNLDAFEVLEASDVLAALYGFLVCYHADVLDSVKRSESPPR